MDLYQHAEISVNSKCSILKYSHQGTKSILAEEIANLKKKQQSDWMIAFLSISQEQDFS